MFDDYDMINDDAFMNQQDNCLLIKENGFVFQINVTSKLYYNYITNIFKNSNIFQNSRYIPKFLKFSKCLKFSKFTKFSNCQKGRSRINMDGLPPLAFDSYVVDKFVPLLNSFTPNNNFKKSLLQKL